ncbi:MAG: hypothetical protein JOZ62_21500, partial [Acidobacteriaceae bacterium]|nr:hypothetical protein [Acidobacteriaceae bacterium]
MTAVAFASIALGVIPHPASGQNANAAELQSASKTITDVGELSSTLETLFGKEPKAGTAHCNGYRINTTPNTKLQYWDPQNGTPKDISNNCIDAWREESPLIVVSINPKQSKLCRVEDANTTDCHSNVAFSTKIFKFENREKVLLPVFVADDDGLHVVRSLILNDDKTGYYTVNGTPVRDLPPEWRTAGWGASQSFRVVRYEVPPKGWRQYQWESSHYVWAYLLRPIPKPFKNANENGIAVAPAKIFDTFSLKQMLVSTSAQLASISGFNQASVFGGLNNIQGIERNTSFLTAQVTTTPTPTITSALSNGLASTNAASNTIGTVDNTSQSLVTLQCPPGTLPSVGSSGAQGCGPISVATGNSGTSTGGGNTGGGTSLQNTSTAGAQNQQTSGSSNNLNTTQQANTTSTTPGQAGIVPPVPVSTALPAPTNVGLSGADLLAEQVELNSQITTLRMLLQGAISDQYLLENNRATKSRAQTTVGFSVSLNPPHRFKHAVAEVRVIVQSPKDNDPVSVVNLLPTQKTYNVAKVTSHQNAFGAGAVIEPVNVGVSTGKAKDRLYLAKDTDTVAFQFNQRAQHQRP